MVYYGNDIYKPNTLYHHGIKGQKWGVRRFQNQDGTLTAEGKRRYYGSNSELNINTSNSGGGGAEVVEKFDDKLEEIKSLQTEEQVKQKLKELEDLWISIETTVPKANEINAQKQQLRYIETLQYAANLKLEEFKNGKSINNNSTSSKSLEESRKINQQGQSLKEQRRVLGLNDTDSTVRAAKAQEQKDRRMYETEDAVKQYRDRQAANKVSQTKVKDVTPTITSNQKKERSIGESLTKAKNTVVKTGQQVSNTVKSTAKSAIEKGKSSINNLKEALTKPKSQVSSSNQINEGKKEADKIKVKVTWTSPVEYTDIRSDLYGTYDSRTKKRK